VEPDRRLLIRFVDTPQQFAKADWLLQRECPTEAASPNIEVAPCEQAHCNE
jgi:hypothetical protein